MVYNQYRFKFYLNANHYILYKGNFGERHPHTWEITINIVKVSEEFVQFHIIEKEIEKIFSIYQGKTINEVSPFNKLNPTLENLCKFFKSKIQRKIEDMGWKLLVIEISETPTRSYIINLINGEFTKEQSHDEYLNNFDLSDDVEKEASLLISEILKNKNKEGNSYE